jgi:glycerol-3-phosphate acyltransferase PlsY
MSSELGIAFFLLGAYLLGSVPFGLLVVRGLTGRDVRQEGSGNIGAANVLRVAGPATAIIVLALDLAKGLVPVLLTRTWLTGQPGADLAAALVGVAAIAGHNWSVFLRGQGGKGIATSYGALLALSPVSGAVAAVIWVVVALLTRYASLASLLSVASVPLVMLARREPAPNFYFGLVALIFGVWRHRGNIQRLRRGEERRLMFRPRQGVPDA